MCCSVAVWFHAGALLYDWNASYTFKRQIITTTIVKDRENEVIVLTRGCKMGGLNF